MLFYAVKIKFKFIERIDILFTLLDIGAKTVNKQEPSQHMQPLLLHFRHGHGEQKDPCGDRSCVLHKPET